MVKYDSRRAKFMILYPFKQRFGDTAIHLNPLFKIYLRKLRQNKWNYLNLYAPWTITCFNMVTEGNANPYLKKSWLQVHIHDFFLEWGF